MKRTVVSMCAFVLLVVSVPGLAQTPQGANAVVEQEVYTELEGSTDGTTYVIVILQPVSMPTAPLSQKMVAVRQIQESVLTNLAAGEFGIVYQYKTFAAMTGHVNAAGLAKLAQDPNVVGVGVDGYGEGHLNDSVPFIDADDVHALGYTGDGITVAVLDTGIDSDHADLSDDIAAGWYHFLGQGTNVGAGAEDDHGHGTNVSGIITSKGMVASVGVAPDADILAIKVLDSNNFGWVSDWASGVDYVVEHKDDYDKLCAINMSLGTEPYYDCPCDLMDAYTQLLQEAIQAAKDAGIVTFASTGNDGLCDAMSSPACLSAATAVAAVYDQDLGREPDAGTYACGCFDLTTAGDKITCFSNRLNDCNELAAPGRLITAPGMGGGTSTYTGTSQAAPHCTGVAALMWEKCLGWECPLTPDNVVLIMSFTGTNTDDPCGTSPNPRRVNALNAVNAACNEVDDLVVCEPQGGANPSHPPTYWYEVTPGDFGRCDFHVRVYDPNPANYTGWGITPWPGATWNFAVHQVGDEWWASWWDGDPNCPNAFFIPTTFQFTNSNASTWGDWTTTISNTANPYLWLIDCSQRHSGEVDGYGYRVHVPEGPQVPGIPTVSEWGLIVLTLLLLTAGTIVVARRRKVAAA